MKYCRSDESFSIQSNFHELSQLLHLIIGRINMKAEVGLLRKHLRLKGYFRYKSAGTGTFAAELYYSLSGKTGISSMDRTFASYPCPQSALVCNCVQLKGYKFYEDEETYIKFMFQAISFRGMKFLPVKAWNFLSCSAQCI